MMHLADPNNSAAVPESPASRWWHGLLGPEDWDAEPARYEVGPGRYPGLRRPLKTIWWLLQILMGVAFLLPLLATLAAIPGVSLIALGMMLDAEAKVGRTGKIRNGFPLLAISTRIGLIGVILAICLTAIFFTSSIAEGQQIVARLSNVPQNLWTIITRVLQAVVFVFLLLAISMGGSPRRFFWPFRSRPAGKKAIILVAAAFVSLLLIAANPGLLVLLLAAMMVGATFRNAFDLYQGIRSGTYIAALNEWTLKLLDVFQPWQHLKLAVKAAAGALLWLIIPTALLGQASTSPAADPGGPALLSLIGGILMIPVAAWLPLLQCHQAATGRFMAIFEVRTAREIIRRVPVRWAIATILLYGLAIPMYLSKVVFTPRDAFWLFTPLFVLTIYPTRILMGWVYYHGRMKMTRTTRLIRWPTKVFMIPALGFYALILFVQPLISPAGPRAMFENHAFLLPVPIEQEDSAK